MFPMVTTADELRSALDALDEAAGPSGRPEDLRVGMMVEVPAAALKIESFLPLLDFVSIGTNDLTQYTVAAERGNAAVASLSDALDPGVLQLVDHVCQAARGRVDVAVCGEVAADPVAVPLLLGLGVRELSVGPHATPGVKARVRELDLEQCTVVAKQALALESAVEVRDFVAVTLGSG
jgi:phosphocarrier protein FPr